MAETIPPVDDTGSTPAPAPIASPPPSVPVVDIYPERRIGPKPFDDKGGPAQRVPEGTDLGAAYLQNKAVAQADDILAAARARIAARTAPKPGEEPPPGGRLPTPRVTEPTSPGFVPAAANVVKDIGGGVVETPTQAIGGAFDAVRNTATTLDNFANWFNGHVFDTTFGGALTLPDPLKAVADNTPQINDPKTTTGGIVRGVSEFLTGFAMGGKVIDSAAPAVGPVTRMFGAGAFSDSVARDPDAGRLADLLDKYPALKNPVTDFLKSDPNDSEVGKRFKNALEGLGLGTLTQGLGLSLKYVRSKMAAGGKGADLKTLLEDPKRYLRETYGEVTPDDMRQMGDPNKSAVVKLYPDQAKGKQAGKKLAASMEAVTSGVPDDIAAKGLLYAGIDPAGKNVYINMARIDTPDDIKDVLQKMANTFAPEIDKAKRGVQSNEATKELADDLGMSVADVLDRRQGQAFNAEQSLAARRMLNTVGAQLVVFAKNAALPNASPLDLFAFNRTMALHQALQAEILGARTEAARALQAWSIPAGQGGIETSRSIQEAIDSMGGSADARMMAKRIAALSGKNDPASINSMVRGNLLQRAGDAYRTTAAALREIYINNMLQSPTTHIVNFASNAAVVLTQIGERRIAEAVSSLWGGSVAPGEAAMMMNSLPAAMKDGFNAASLALRTGKSTFGDMTRIDSPRIRATSAEAFGLNPDNAIGKTIDLLSFGLNVPTRLMMTADEFFKGIHYRMEIYTQAQRQAFAEGLTGKELADRIADLAAHPTDTMRMMAKDQALYATFNQAPGPMGQGFINLREKIPLGWFLFPFVKTPSNIVNFAFERSPLAPLVSQWRADIAAGGARRDLALVKMGTGTTLMLLTADYADSGFISGNGPFNNEEAGNARRQAMMREGWQPYSVKIGDKWYSYNRFDPLGFTMGMAADLVDLKNRYEVNGDHMDEFNEILGAAMAAVARTTDNKTYMQSFSNFFAFMSDPSRNSKSYLDQMVGSLVPSGVAVVARINDPFQREMMKTGDYIDARIAGLREKLTLRRDLWGEPLGDNSGMGGAFNAVSPVRVSQTKPNPIDTEILKQQFSILPIPKKGAFDGVAVDLTNWPKVYEEYVRLAGNELKDPAFGLGLKDRLDQLVTGQAPDSIVYNMKSDGPDGGKETMVKGIVSQYRQMAQRQIMADPRFAEFTNEITGKRQTKQDLRLPNGVTIH